MLAEAFEFGYNALVNIWSQPSEPKRFSPLARRLLAVLIGAALTAGAAGCEAEKKSGAATDTEDAGSGPVIGGKLGEAVAAASASAPNGGDAPAGADGPPPGGIFAPGQADAKHPALAPPSVEVLGDGAEPRVTLSMGKPHDGEKTQLVIQVRSGGQQGLPPVQLGLTTHIGDGKKKGAKAGKKADVEAAPDGRITISIDKVSVIAQAGGAVPQQVSDALSSLESSKLRYQLTPTGGVDFSFELAKKADPGLDMILRACQDIVSAMLVAPPKKPVGVGGFWMVTDRLTSLGVDVVRYRVFKVEQVLGGQAKLSLEVRQYAANTTLNLALGPQMANATLAQYEAKGQGEVIFGGDRLLPADAKMALAIGAGMLPPGAQNQPNAQQQMAVLQLDTVGQLVADPIPGAAAPPDVAGGAVPAAPSPVAPPAPAAP